MKVFFKNVDEVKDGIDILSEELGYTISDESDAELIIEAETTEENILKIEMKKGVAHVLYGGGKCRFYRSLGWIFEALSDGLNDFLKEEHPLFNTNGSFFDCSRNAVLNLPTIKTILRKTALMGMSTFMLYTEDTFEVPEEPYFGHMRGRYTKAELNEIDSYAIKLGIEVIPCVELLGHMEMFLKWDCATKYKDTERVMLAGSEDTYRLIHNMVKAYREGLSSKRFAMGLDEAYDLGRGRYLDINGYRKPTEIFCEHLERIVEIVKSFGFQPMMYSDMFFQMASKKGVYKDLDVEFSQEVLNRVPEGVQQIYWDYGTEPEDFYYTMLKKHDVFGDNTFFLGGVLTYVGPCPDYEKTLYISIPALNACKRSGTKEVMISVWHNGAECSLITSLPAIMLYSEYDYTGSYDKEHLAKRFKFLCRAELDDFYDLQRADHPHLLDNPEKMHPTTFDRYTNPTIKREIASRFLLFNDPLIGLVDKNIEDVDARKFYKRLIDDYKDRGTMEGLFAPAFDYYKRMLDVLELKADFGVRLKKVYDAKDKEGLMTMSDEAAEIEKRLDILRKSHRASWLYYNKAFGFEIFDSYYGTLMARFETVRYRIEEFLAGNIEKIEELCETRLKFGYSDFGESDGGELIFHNNRFQRIYTANVSYTSQWG